MKEMANNSVDSIVTDPPYELGFMGKSWDASGIAFNIEVWQEALRVLKPGGHLLAFSGSRTYHRMTVAIEDAGFEIRDQIQWIYGSGFPKSMNISLAIDKANGLQGDRGSAINVGGKGERNDIETSVSELNGKLKPAYSDAKSPEAKQWQGWGTALKPAHEPIVLARKPLIGTVAANVLTHGVGGLNIDGSRVGTDEVITNHSRSSESAISKGKYGDSAAQETHQTDGQSLGRWPANVIHDGSDEVVSLFPDSKGGAFPAKRGQAVNTAFASGQETEGGFRAMGDSGSAARFFYCAKASKRDRNDGLDDFEIKQVVGGGGGIGDYLENVDSASGKYGSEKAPSKNHHPTVKPTDLMRYLCRLITPPEGIVLDPFMGSGSTGKAATLEGFNFIGIDQSAEYVAIAQARIDHTVIQMASAQE